MACKSGEDKTTTLVCAAAIELAHGSTVHIACANGQKMTDFMDAVKSMFKKLVSKGLEESLYWNAYARCLDQRIIWPQGINKYPGYIVYFIDDTPLIDNVVRENLMQRISRNPEGKVISAELAGTDPTWKPTFIGMAAPTNVDSAKNP